MREIIFLLVVLGTLWGDEQELLERMSVDEKIGQLFMIPACPARQEEEHFEDLKRCLETWHVGGVILKQGTLASASLLLERLSSYQLLYAIDAEWGLAMTLTDGVAYPKNVILGAIQDEELLYRVGEEIGQQCRALGVHINFAPVVDVATNPNSPITCQRSFGNDPHEVAWRAECVVRGMQAAGVMACAKHFPGHGGTVVDSHLELPVVMQMELEPFKRVIEAGVSCVMSGHLVVKEGPPASLSGKIIQGVLRDELGFCGLVITDALNMRALTSHFSVEEIALQAFLAGNDILLYGDHIAPSVDRILRSDVPRAINALKQAYAQGIITERDLDLRVLKILRAKRIDFCGEKNWEIF